MKILLTGANGQVGWELVQQGYARGEQIQALDSTALDITDETAVHAAIAASQADVVINAAAYTAVDKAEQKTERERAFAVNRDGVAYLALACAAHDIPLLHISTDYVFDGQQTHPYQEGDAVAPLGVYGLSKWQGEQALREHWVKHIVLRVSWVFGSHGHNFVKTMLRLGREREQLRIVADQHGCPTFAGAIADTLLTLAHRVAFSSDSVWGTYHYCGTPATTWFDFAQRIFAIARNYEPLQVKEVIAINSIDYPTPVTRPANSVLSCHRLQAQFGIILQPWDVGLEQVLQRLAVGPKRV